MITRKDMTQQLEWRLSCIRKRISQLDKSQIELICKLQYEFQVTQEILKVVEENTHENQA